MKWILSKIQNERRETQPSANTYLSDKEKYSKYK